MSFFGSISAASGVKIVTVPPLSTPNTLSLTTSNFEYNTLIDEEIGFTNRSAFSTLKFSTSGTSIDIGLFTDIDSASYVTEAKISIYDAAWNWVDEIVPDVNIRTRQEFTKVLPSAGTYYVVESGNVLEGGLGFKSTALVDITGSDMAVETISLKQDLVINVGDSISIGDGTSNNTRYGYQMLLRKAMATTDFIADGFGGEYAFNHFGDATKRSNAANRYKAEFDRRTGRKVILFTMGTNDYGARNITPAEFTSKVQPAFDTIIATIPTVEIIILSPLVRGNETTLNNGGAHTLDAFRTELQNIATATTGVTYNEGKTVLTLPDDFTGDQLHPNEAGHAKLSTHLQGII